MFEAYQRKDYAAGLALGRQVTRDSPLTASAYYYQGMLLEAASDEEGVDEQADEWFRAERVLDPVMPDVPRHQAQVWAGYDPARETAMLLTELGRLGRIDQALGIGRKWDLQYYQDMVSHAAPEPDVQRSLLAVTRPDPRFGLAWAQAAGLTLAGTRQEILAADRAVTGSGGPSRRDWYLQPESAGPVRPENGSASASDWENAGWAVRLRQMVYAGQHRQAVEAMVERYGISLALPGEAGALEAEGGTGAAGSFCAAWRAGDREGAKRGLAAASVGAEPEAQEVWRWRAAAAAREGRWKDAWLALERYVRHTRQMEWP